MNLKHGGNLHELSRRSGIPAGDILDFSASINPLGFPETLRRVVERELGHIVNYPDPECTALRNAIAAYHQIDPDSILVGNGSSELLYHIPWIPGLKRALIPVPCYTDYIAAAESAGLSVMPIDSGDHDAFSVDLDTIEHLTKPTETVDDETRADTLVFLGRPANPTGYLANIERLREIIEGRPNVIFCIDEAFLPFIGEDESLIGLSQPNLIVVRSFTKFYAIPGIRLGYCVADRDLIDRLIAILPTWSVGTLPQAVGVSLLADTEYGDRTREFIRTESEFLFAQLDSLPGIKPYESKVNYMLVRCSAPNSGGTVVARRLLESGIAVRTCDDVPGLDASYIRVAVRSRLENQRLIDALAEIADTGLEHSVSRRPEKRKPSIMFQGTSSNAGKSMLAAAFCRIMLQDGYRVAPFKAQNMSLNSYVTADGGEMGRAQVVQAQACRVAPDVRMNPVLLKPNTDTGCQVIVEGKPIGSMKAVSYYDYKRRLFESVTRCYDGLSSEYDAMVIEGAGSPGEVNLKKHDIVNMRMAAYAQAPVMIVGDIDRGGVFAAFVGTMEVLNELERSLVSGFIVNKFRGDVSLLDPALEYTLEHTGKPVLGVVPWILDHGIPEEDSVSFKETVTSSSAVRSDRITIAVIDLPHISNFTDFDALRIEPDVDLRIIRESAAIPDDLDCLIIPGSKNVPGDIGYLRSRGLLNRIASVCRSGTTEVVGVCGGLQMLGRRIHDPESIESGTGTDSAEEGIGILDFETVLASEKILEATTATHLGSGLHITGYEIHHGVSSGVGAEAAVVRNDGTTIGYAHTDLPVWGTYLHGLFDEDRFRRWFIDGLRERRGLARLGRIQAVYDLDVAYDRIAETVRNSVDVETMYRLMGL